MSQHESPSSANFEPTPEELKTLYDSLYNAIKSPQPSYDVRTYPNLGGGAMIHEVSLTPMDMLEVTGDEKAKYIIVKAKDILRTYGSGETSIWVEIGSGEDDSPLQMVQFIFLEKQPNLNPAEEDNYYISKSQPDIEDTSKPVEVIDLSEDPQRLKDFIQEVTTEPTEEDELLGEMADDLSRITPEDLEMLRRLMEVLSEG